MIQKSFTQCLWCPCCTPRLPCGNFIPKLGHHLFFAGFPGLCFPCKWPRCADRPRQDARQQVPTKPGNCTAEYTGTALLKKGIPLTDENLGVNNMLSHLEEDGLKMHDVVPTLYQRSVRCSLAQLGSQSNEPGTNKDNPIEVPPPSTPSNEASFPSSVSLSSSKTTYVTVLLASMAAARACQWRRLLHRRLTEAEGYPQAISYHQSFGLLKAC